MTRQEFQVEHGWELPEASTPGSQLKTPKCTGCPLEHNGTTYVPDEIHPTSRVLVVLDAPSSTDLRVGVPGCDAYGDILNTRYLPLAGLSRGPVVSVSHAIRCAALDGNGRIKSDVLSSSSAAALHCMAAYATTPPASTELVVIQGEVAFNHAVTTNTTSVLQDSHASIHQWRGFTLPDSSSFVTLGPRDTWGNGVMSWVSELDWRHIGGILLRDRRIQAAYPRLIRATADTIDWAVEDFFNQADENPGYFTIDTEYVPGTTHLTILGVGYGFIQDINPLHSQASTMQPNTSIGSTGSDSTESGSPRCVIDQDFQVLSIPWDELTPAVKDYYRWRLGRGIRTRPCVFHNAVADLFQLRHNLQLQAGEFFRIEDTMLAHAIQWCELPHTLDFLSSVYGEYGKFKHLWDTDQVRYNYGDVVDTWSAWKVLSKGFKLDQAAYAIYREQSIALIPILLEAGERGIRVNTTRVAEVFKQYAATIAAVRDYASLSVGYPLNLNSGQQLKHYLYTERRFPEQISRKTKRPTTDDDAIAKLRQSQGIVYDSAKEHTFDRDDEFSYSVLSRVAAGADPILECRAFYAGIYQLINSYIIGLGRGVYGETISDRTRKKARTRYWNDGLSDGDVVNRIYPNFAIHAQKTGRWSTTSPPLAQLPASLRDIVCPRAGEVCVSWDWSAIEPRVLQALCGSTLLKKTFDEGFDLHTWTVCYMFGYDMPPDLVDPHKSASCEAWRAKYRWQGKDDPRRVFAKQGRYEMWYGGSGRNAAHAAVQFGLNATDLRVALSKLATSDPAYYAWKVRNEAEVKRSSMVRTFMGRPRRFLSIGDARRREGLDQPMQGAVSDIFNSTVVLLAASFPQLRWGWGMHDSQKWWIDADALTPSLFESIKAVVERPHRIGSQETRFPGDFEIILPPERGGLKVTPQEYFALA